MKSKDEIVVIVDENNNVIGAQPRHVMRARGAIHRAAYILVFNSKGKIFVQKRTMTKDVYPGYYDVAAGGVVLDGETYEESAARELAEELGIRNVPLSYLFEFFYSDAGNHIWGRAYFCVYDGHMVLQEEEVDDGEFVEVDKALQADEYGPSTPDSLYVLGRYADERITE
jgi:8-oxo-dGTP pyrophosphatase MutT (NUDIX family)